VDARDKPGHDEFRDNRRFRWLHFESDSQDDGFGSVSVQKE
jgi:hypothetical protein